MHVFIHLNNSLATNGSTSKFHFGMFTPSYPFQLFNEIFETHHAQFFSCSDLRVGAWLIVQPIFPAF
jgi:hypothetical protein